MKKISLIIPCYNLSSFVVPMLESLKYIDLKKTEVIIIDDCSSDDTLELIVNFEGYKEQWILIKNKTNQGVSRTRNIGIKKSSGDFIYFLDGDDTLTEEFKKIESLKINTMFARFKYKKDGFKNNKHNYLESVQVSTMLFSKKLFQSNNLHFPEKIIFEDNHFLMLLTNELRMRGEKKYSTYCISPFKYTEFREGSITATKHLSPEVMKSFDAIKKLDVNPKIHSFFTYQLWNSFMVNSKMKINGFIKTEDKREVKEYLKNEMKSMKFYFFDLPILWKIRFLSYKLFKFVF